MLFFCSRYRRKIEKKILKENVDREREKKKNEKK